MDKLQQMLVKGKSDIEEEQIDVDTPSSNYITADDQTESGSKNPHFSVVFYR